MKFSHLFIVTNNLSIILTFPFDPNKAHIKQMYKSITSIQQNQNIIIDAPPETATQKA